MPIYEDKTTTRDDLLELRKKNVCSECGRYLYIYLDLTTKQQYIACPTPGHEGISREYQPQREDYETDIRRSVEMEQKIGHEATRALATIPMHGQLTQPQAMLILKLAYPRVPENEIIRCAIFCRDFGLHPLAKEVFLIPFKDTWVMVVGIPASRKMAHNLKGEFSFLDDTPRAATDTEIIKQFGRDSDEAKLNIISVTKLRGERGNLAIGFGLYLKTEKPQGMEKGNTRRNMANIRSERQAMDRLPGRPLPKVEVVDEAYIDVPDVGKVIESTGEVVESIASEIPSTVPEPEPATEAHHCDEHDCDFEFKTSRFGGFYAHKMKSGWCNEKKKEAKPVEEPLPEPEPEAPIVEPEVDKQPKRDPDTIKTINELQKSLFEDYQLQPKEQLAELNLEGWTELAISPAEAYIQVAASR